MSKEYSFLFTVERKSFSSLDPLSFKPSRDTGIIERNKEEVLRESQQIKGILKDTISLLILKDLEIVSISSRRDVGVQLVEPYLHPYVCWDYDNGKKVSLNKVSDGPKEIEEFAFDTTVSPIRKMSFIWNKTKDKDSRFTMTIEYVIHQERRNEIVTYTVTKQNEMLQHEELGRYVSYKNGKFELIGEYKEKGFTLF